jgi:putative transcriptional regulator
MINHHISDESLLDFASGALGEAWSIAVASHLTFCTQCCDNFSKMEALGGFLLSSIDPVAGMDNDFDAIKSRLDERDELKSKVPKVTSSGKLFPQPLSQYIGDDLNGLGWRRLGLKAHQIIVKTGDESATARLLKIPGGEPIPEHSHGGLEMTLVISGAYSDITGKYARGDFQEADEEVEHRPIVEIGEECICLIVTNAPLRFSNLTTRIVQPILGV